jgi:LemA protein
MLMFYFVFFVLAAAGAALARAYRRLMALDARCEAAASAVERERAARHALLPALVGVTRAFAPQERDVAEGVVKAHAAALRAPTPQAQLLAELRLSDAVGALVARVEATPRLQALEDFRAFQAALADADLRLAAARKALAVATSDYNAARRGFPEQLFALRGRFARRAFYDIAVEPGGAEALA